MTDQHTTRRTFLAQSGAAALGAAAIPSILSSSALGAITGRAKPMKILMLGGTGFAGPKMVNRAVENGHEVTLFNRGRTGPDMFPDLEHIQGDRYSDLSGLENAVADGRTWDAVIDTFTYVPKTVTDCMDILLPAMSQYVVISTVSVYANQSTPGMDETAPLATVSDEIANNINTHREVGAHYGAMKARVEQAAEDRFPGRVCNIRPGLIVGDRDTTGRFTYWPVRASEGGTMIAPGSGDDFVQIIDVRDLGDFTIHCIEKKHMGAYNAITPGGDRTIKDIVDSSIRVAKKMTKTETSAEWIDAPFLAANGVQAWQHMPTWVPTTIPGYEGHGQVSTEKSINAGLTCRPTEDSCAAALDYFINRGKEIKEEQGDEYFAQWQRQVRGGLDPQREQEVLKLWMDQKDDG